MYYIFHDLNNSILNYVILYKIIKLYILTKLSKIYYLYN